MIGALPTEPHVILAAAGAGHPARVPAVSPPAVAGTPSPTAAGGDSGGTLAGFRHPLVHGQRTPAPAGLVGFRHPLVHGPPTPAPVPAGAVLCAAGDRLSGAVCNSALGHGGQHGSVDQDFEIRWMEGKP